MMLWRWISFHPLGQTPNPALLTTRFFLRRGERRKVVGDSSGYRMRSVRQAEVGVGGRVVVKSGKIFIFAKVQITVATWGRTDGNKFIHYKHLVCNSLLSTLRWSWLATQRCIINMIIGFIQSSQSKPVDLFSNFHKPLMYQKKQIHKIGRILLTLVST